MKNIIFSLLALTVLACQFGGKRTSKRLSSEQMISILIDVHILEAKISYIKERADSVNKIYNTLELEIFKSHGTDKMTYEESFAYYSADPQKLGRIYETVVDSLNVMEQQLMVDFQNGQDNKNNVQEDQKGKTEENSEDENEQKSILKKDTTQLI